MGQHCVKVIDEDDDLSLMNGVEEIAFVLQLHSVTHKALPEKVSITCILQDARQTNCALWCFGVWLHRFQQPPTDFAFTEKNNLEHLPSDTIYQCRSYNVGKWIGNRIRTSCV